jgi:VanZ family protein
MRFVPALAWTALVLVLGSAYFGADYTGSLLSPVLRAVAPLTGLRVYELHALLRKAAHFTEYAVLAALWFYAVAWRRPAAGASWIALCIALTCAVADEAHQSALPNRTGSARDVVIDASGAVVALSVVRRRRQPPR